MGRIHILFAHSFENEGNFRTVSAQVYNAEPCKVASKKPPQEYKEMQLGHHDLKFTGRLQFCFQSSVEPLTDSNLATSSTTAVCKI